MTTLTAPPQPWRILASCLFFTGAFAAVAMRLHHLQVTDAQDLTTLGESQRRITFTLPAERGAIYAADGTPLALTHATWDLKADTAYMDDRLRATVELSRLLGLDRDELRGHFETGANGRTLARHLDDGQRRAVEALKLAGIYLQASHQRQYPEGRLASHILGHVSYEGLGSGGIEQRCDGDLRGVDGYERLAADARRRAIAGPLSERRDPQPGGQVHLTILPALQKELEAALAAAAEKHNPLGICGIAVRPATGEILAMASWPDFAPAEPGSSPEENRRDRNLAFIYESGSTMKPLVAGACVADGVVGWNTQIDCEHGRWKSPWRAKPVTSHPHDVLSVIEIVAKSDNIGMCKMFGQLHDRRGIERNYHWMRLFGFGQRTGIELPGEQYGILPRLERWIPGTMVTASYGHGLSVTPIQMVMAQSAVANGGTWLPPRLIDRVVRIGADGRAEVQRPAPVRESCRIFPQEVADGIERSMVAVMEAGTGKALTLDGYTSAGKTGTTDVLVNGGYLASGGPHIGSYVGWGPAQPHQAAELLVLIAVDQPRKKDGSPAGHPDYFGSVTAGPAVQRVLQAGLALLGVPEDRPREPEEDARP